MELLIQQYLIATHSCPLPGLGTLTLEKKSAEFSISDHTFFPPKWNLTWINEENDKIAFVNYLASALHTDIHEAGSRLDEWVRQATNNYSEFSLTIPGLGKWKKEAGVEISFIPEKMSDALYPVKVKKIIRSGAIHQVRVGDTEHTNVHMSELLQQQKKTTKLELTGWIILLIAVMAASVITYYSMNGQQPGGIFGNTQKLETDIAPETYQLIP